MRKLWLPLAVVAMTAALWLAGSAFAGQLTAFSSGTAAFRGTASGSDELQFPEIRRRIGASGTPLDQLPRAKKQGKFPKKSLDAPTVASSGVAASNPGLGTSVDGLTARDQRLANGGNQFTVEPPDQALCVGGDFVVESVNTVLRVKSKATGANLTGVQDLNTFYGYPAQFNRTTLEQGPFLTDPVCLYVPQINRFVQVALTLDVVPASGNFLGTNHLDVAISNTSNPTGTWTIYKIPAQNDGTEGTPDNGCPTRIRLTRRRRRTRGPSWATTRTSGWTRTASICRQTATACSATGSTGHSCTRSGSSSSRDRVSRPR